MHGFSFIAGALAMLLAQWLLKRSQRRRARRLAERNARAKRELGEVFEFNGVMTPDEIAEMHRAQRESWARGQSKHGPRHAIAKFEDPRRPVRG